MPSQEGALKDLNMAYNLTPQIGGIDLTASGTTQLFPLGMSVIDNSGTTWRYIYSDIAVTAGKLYYISSTTAAWTNLTVVPTGAISPFRQVVAAQTTTTVAGYQWMAVQGPMTLLCDGDSIAAGAQLYTSQSVAGAVDDDTGGSAVKINGLFSLAAISANATGLCMAAVPLSVNI